MIFGHGYTEGMLGHGSPNGMMGHGYTYINVGHFSADGRRGMAILREMLDMAILKE